MRRSIATVCLSGTLDEKLRAAAAAGFEAVEIFENDLIVSPLPPRAIAKLAEDEGVAIELYQPFRDFEGVREPIFRNNLRRAEAKFEVMRELGTDLILVCSNVGTATIDNDELAADQLGRLADSAERAGMRIAYEALAWGKFVSDIDHANRIVELADHSALGHCLDSFHMLSRGWSTSSIDSIRGEKIFFVQIADATRLDMDVLSWSRHHRVFPGEGGWDLADFMLHIAGTGYDGTVSLEVFNDVFRQTPVDRTATDAMRSLVWLEDQTARRLASDRDASDMPPGMAFDRLPEVAQPSGFNFAELRVQAAPAMGEVLRQLGLEYRGSHRTKNVKLWSTGTARVILNMQDAATEEARIAAVGFDVADPELAALRATSLLAPVVPRESEAGEEVLRGFSAPDAREVFLGQGASDGSAAWVAEFSASEEELDGAGRAHLGGLSHIDHVNMAQPWQYFDEAVLFYESTLSLKSQPSLDIAAPNGLVRSQVMRSDDGCVRLALNVAPLLAESLPAGEHIAFATDDIIATARAAAEAGFAPLAIPANYYDDLAARFPLDEAELATLRELNLLYDRDGDSEFLQFYTSSIGNVFFEVVERRGGYDGYGAGNAPIRLAAQFQHDRAHRAR